MSIDEPSLAGQHGAVSTAELISRATAQVSTLVRDELALAQQELMAKGKRAGIGGGLFGGAAVLGMYGLGLLLALSVVALDLIWPLWLSVLVVAAVVFAAAAVAALSARSQFKRMTPPVPSQAMAGISADMQAVKTAVREGRQS